MKKYPLLSFEHKMSPLLPLRKFYQRLFFNAFAAFLIIAASLMIGVWGYMSFACLGFVDALENASMILGGMGPVNELHNDAAKYFASFYALFSGITFLSIMAVLIAPILHRGMHRFHLESEDEIK